ncbi:MAG: hypothetical protein MZU79_01820 [Anaerotruncus sp.]|nr:hypothetical protein [Anaerotruncus sp.]
MNGNEAAVAGSGPDDAAANGSKQGGQWPFTGGVPQRVVIAVAHAEEGPGGGWPSGQGRA